MIPVQKSSMVDDRQGVQLDDDRAPGSSFVTRRFEPGIFFFNSPYLSDNLAVALTSAPASTSYNPHMTHAVYCRKIPF
jgi:hypothetical protein